ncbi:hypothetical protein BCF58_2369 [Chryseobacterium defluvii]|uniref:Uncharacterized protein n=1 Tax=Chryseobacterium defluvii TaxID=160396 RepID=A0A495SDB4_9FLAO|nr:hypothetical protein BCF58_2369 [Chryseobacterium defluvii]
MFKNKNDYTFIVFDKENNQLCKVEFVHDCFKSCQWLDQSKNYSHWYYVNIYVRRSGQFLKRHYKGQFIQRFPR